VPGRIRVAAALVVACVIAGAVRIAEPGSAASQPVRLSAGAVTVVEGDTGDRTVRVPLTLSAPMHDSLQVHYSVGPYRSVGAETVTAADMQFASGTVRFDVSPTTGRTPVQVDLPVVLHANTVPEGPESYAVTLSHVTVDGPPDAVEITTPVAIGSVYDDDGAPGVRVSVGSVTLAEGGPGVTELAAVPVTLSAPVAAPVSVRYVVKGVTADPRVDFRAPTSGSVTFPPGVVVRSLDVPIVGDDRSEGDETVAIGLSDPAGAVLGTTLGVVLVRDPTPFGRAPGPRVTITGDSITDLAAAALRRELSARYSTSILAVPGATMTMMTPYLRDQLATGPDVAVIDLGTNDAMTDNPHWARDVAAIRATIAPVPCVELVTVNDTVADRMGSFFTRRSVTVGARINAALHEAAAMSPHVHLVDWKAAVDGDAAPGGPNVLTSDGIHPTPLGQAWLAHHIREAVDRDCR